MRWEQEKELEWGEEEESKRSEGGRWEKGGGRGRSQEHTEVKELRSRLCIHHVGRAWTPGQWHLLFMLTSSSPHFLISSSSLKSAAHWERKSTSLKQILTFSHSLTELWLSAWLGSQDHVLALWHCAYSPCRLMSVTAHQISNLEDRSH